MKDFNCFDSEAFEGKDEEAEMPLHCSHSREQKQSYHKNSSTKQKHASRREMNAYYKNKRSK